jgi:photosystem II stability/assembly factor-like uncharacterized protein
VIRGVAVAFAVVLTACAAQPASSPSPSATLAAASPTPTPAPTATRTLAASPTPTLIPLPSFTELSAPSGTVLWAFVAGTRLFRSTDRGDTWTERPVPPQPVNGAVTFIDDHEGWFASLVTPATQCATQLLAITHTTEAGASWQTVTTAGIPAEQCKDNLVFSDAQHGSLDAFDPNSPPVIYRTADGGRTWAASRLPDPPGFVTRPAGFTLRPGLVRTFGAVRLVEATGLIEDQQPPQRRYVFASADDGATWTYRVTVPDPDSTVVFVTETRWFQLSVGAVPKETTDGGATWRAFATDYKQAAPIAPAIVFGDAQTGYATVRGVIQRTVDGGARWTSIRTPGTF